MDFLKDQEYYLKIKQAVYLSVNKNATDIQVMKIVKLNYREALHMFNDKIGFEETFHDNGKTFELVQNIRRNRSLSSNSNINKNKDTYNLLHKQNHYLAKNDKDKLVFLILLALTFRLDLDCLTFLSGENDKDLYFKISTYTSDKELLKIAIRYLFENERIDAQNNLDAAIEYLNNLEKSYLDRDLETYNDLLNYIGDTDIKKIKRELKEDDKMISPDDLEKIFTYQLKYSLSTRNICNAFNLARGKYVRFVNLHLEYHPDLKSQYEIMTTTIGYGITLRSSLK